MEREQIRDLLTQLRDTIRLERDHARKLEMDAMLADVQKKDALIRALQTADRLHPEDRQLAREVMEENRQNAFLFRSTLGWIKDTMVFFGRKTVPVTYSQSGISHNNTINGRLLSGRI